MTAFKDNTHTKQRFACQKAEQTDANGWNDHVLREKEKALAILSKIQEDDDLLSLARNNADIPSAIEVECHTVNGSINDMDKGNVNDDENLDSLLSDTKWQKWAR